MMRYSGGLWQAFLAVELCYKRLGFGGQLVNLTITLFSASSMAFTIALQQVGVDLPHFG